MTLKDSVMMKEGHLEKVVFDREPSTLELEEMRLRIVLRNVILVFIIQLRLSLPIVVLLWL